MMDTLARTYVLVLFSVELLLFAAALLLHVGAWMGASRFSIETGYALLGVSLYVNFITAALAKERNVWKNEFKSCPKLLRRAALVFGIYGLIFVFWRVVLFPDEGGSESLLIISAIPLSFTALFLCIPYALLWTDTVQPSDLVKRVRTSFFAAIFGMAILLLHRVGTQPHMNR